MAKELIGYRRLYDSIGCSIANQQELEIHLTLKECNVIVYIGDKPKRGIIITTKEAGKFIVPGEISMMGEWKFFKDATTSNYPRKFFTEIQCIKPIEVPQELSEKFHEDPKSGVHNEIIDIAQKELENFIEVCDLIAGVIGLRFHPQFIRELINDNLFVIRNTDDWAYRINGSALEILEELSLNQNGIQKLETTLRGVEQASSEAHEFATTLFQWLHRAWSERDSVSKFLALFTPLEVALGKFEKDNFTDEQQDLKFNKIKELIINSKEQEKEQLLAYFEHLRKLSKPSLATRFEALAKEANLPNYEIDIIAFRKFNKSRNSLVHRGDSEVDLQVIVSEEENRKLEDLVERYISWILFRDQIVYPSRRRNNKR